MNRAYKYLVHKEGRAAEDCVPEHAKAAVVIKDRADGQYKTFRDYNELAAAYPCSAEHCIDEVIFGERPQKLRFDIDNMPGHETKQQVLDAIRAVLRKSYNTTAVIYYLTGSRRSDKFAASTSRGKTKYKLSAHIIVDCVVPGALAAELFYEQCKREFCSALLARGETPPDIFDNVYRSTQHFRTAYSAHDNSEDLHAVLRPSGWAKSVLAPEEIRARCMVHPVENTIVAGSYIEPAPRLKDMPSRPKPVLREHTFSEYPDPGPAHEVRTAFKLGDAVLVVYNRVAPSHCEFCGRVHDSDNTLRALVTPEGHKFYCIRKKRLS